LVSNHYKFAVYPLLNQKEKERKRKTTTTNDENIPTFSIIEIWKKNQFLKLNKKKLLEDRIVSW